MKVARLWLLLLALGFGQSLTSRAEIRFCRYELTTQSGDPAYSGVLTNLNPRGPTYEVEKDTAARTMRVAKLQNGKRISEIRYQFSGDEKLPNVYEQYKAGEHTGTVNLQRSENGSIKREDFRSIQGEITRYTEYVRKPGKVEMTEYSAEGALKWKHRLFFSERGFLVRQISFPASGTQSLEIELDEATGQKKSATQFKADKIVNDTVKYTYDGDGNLERADAYNASGEWRSTQEYSGNLLSKRVYRDTGSIKKEISFIYDAKEQLKASAISINSRVVCTLTYDRLPDGTAKRTLAKDPDGNLWAEYPSEVREVDRQGQPVAGTAATIYKKDPWW
ncbi:MAG: hypothetical protein C5B50_29305 [Verrucomicrobia bacterium]|nr:MAG: hypothetical protein C5B50_29305 [Verrucomicrobiota bacterium]